jgi:hypothetical protein
MSYAYHQLQLAVQCLAQSGTLQERLAKALTESLIYLRPKDLPAACRKDLRALVDASSIEQAKGMSKNLAAKIRVVSDREANAMAKTILRLYDTVTRYQPLSKEGEAFND